MISDKNFLLTGSIQVWTLEIIFTFQEEALSQAKFQIKKANAIEVIKYHQEEKEECAWEKADKE